MDPAIVDRLEEALKLLPDGDSSERAQVLCRLGIELYWGGDHDRMQTLAREGIDMARRVGDPHALGAVLNVGALLYDDIGDAEQRLALSREAARAADAAHDGAAAHLARNLASWAQLELGDRAGWEQTIREGIAKAARDARAPDGLVRAAVEGGRRAHRRRPGRG